jgi:hypothetical protein
MKGFWIRSKTPRLVPETAAKTGSLVRNANVGHDWTGGKSSACLFSKIEARLPKEGKKYASGFDNLQCGVYV